MVEYIVVPGINSLRKLNFHLHVVIINRIHLLKYSQSSLHFTKDFGLHIDRNQWQNNAPNQIKIYFLLKGH